VDLDRSSIQAHDFPTVRRGYEPAAVDAHLEALADAVEALRAGAPPASTAAAASERVGAIIAAAEATAADIERSAREEADRIRADAASGSRAEVESLRAAVAGLRERAVTLDREVAALLDQVAVLMVAAPGGAQSAAEPASAGGSRSSEPAVAPPGPTVAPMSDPPAGEEPVDEEEGAREPAAAQPEAALRAARHEAEIPAPSGDDAENARLVALSMALAGTSRDDTDRYLAEHYAGLTDRAALLDEVYETAGG
jgi:DivIVA domain-containing protein